jgi:hypothetical protein
MLLLLFSICSGSTALMLSAEERGVELSSPAIAVEAKNGEVLTADAADSESDAIAEAETAEGAELLQEDQHLLPSLFEASVIAGADQATGELPGNLRRGREQDGRGGDSVRPPVFLPERERMRQRNHEGPESAERHRERGGDEGARRSEKPHFGGEPDMDARNRIRTLRLAAQNLRASGLADVSAELTHRAESMERELEELRVSRRQNAMHPENNPDHGMRQLAEQVELLRNDVRQLNMKMDRVLEMLSGRREAPGERRSQSSRRRTA